MRSGDIDNRFTSSRRAVEGTRAHQRVQNSYGAEYEREVALKHSLEYEDFIIEVEGRVDGIIREENKVIIDEIKSTLKPLEEIKEDYNLLHWAQGKCYGYMYAKKHNIEELEVQITYINIDTDEVKKFTKKFTFQELEAFFMFLIDRYTKWANMMYYWQLVRDESIRELSFPYKSYRRGQRKLAVAVYKTIKEAKKLYAQAPTGIGKTISTIFPSIKAIGEGLLSKIFYLTAKTIAREVALNAIDHMAANGLRVKAIVLTAKEKICTNDKISCNPEDCPYAKGHYDRVNDALMDVLENEDIITRDLVLKYAEIHRVCPFEFSLDLCLFSDVIICDYNFVFDPSVYLKRFFEAKGDYAFLIDEAHNLVDRSRKMFSAEIYKSYFLKYKRELKEDFPKLSDLFNSCNKAMNKIKREYLKGDFYYQKEEIAYIYSPIRKLINNLEDWLLQEREHRLHEELQDLYFDLLKFINMSELYDSSYVTYIEKLDDDIVLRLFCVDASSLLKEALERGRAAIFFSATLTPLDYYKNLLGGNADDYTIAFPSPFPKDNLCVLIGDRVSTKYKDREVTYLDVVRYIEEFICQRQGNYFVFFPSYKYMEYVYEAFLQRNPHVYTIIQNPSMDEEEREDFLKKFSPKGKETMLAFAVLGGIFSEGIDLIGDKLIGAVIVGVGLPKICPQQDIIKDYFNFHNGLGFEYAYMYPGMNKVLQAAGRVIRSEKDKGALLLIDERFTNHRYLRLFPREWMDFKRVKREKDIAMYLNIFWNKHVEK
ncbi:MAG: ATP-dependent DNA helicase [Tissierellia bacterium]|nr:ATP-dependent DNA helicase [Tissierellia bacterium]